MNTLKHTISWFEIPVSDMKRAILFYEQIMDVKMQEMFVGEGLTMAFFPMEMDTVSGALCHHPDYYQPNENGVVIYLNAGDNLDLTLNKVEKAGGKIVMPKRIISENFGYMAMFNDSEGNRIALHSKH